MGGEDIGWVEEGGVCGLVGVGVDREVFWLGVTI